MARDIKPLGLDLNRDGRLVVKLSEEPPNEWRGFFASQWKTPRVGELAGEKHFDGWEPVGSADGPGAVFNLDVDTFVRLGYVDKVSVAAAHANHEMEGLDVQRAHETHERAQQLAETKARLESEREKARRIKFER